mmetsp:Transcript_62777/g.147298  ORF Transcript_62777/g.147298 Transcript_62777/m.147298 type:complete len:209 (+) Transcript_62777:32-658(+)
MAAETRRKPLVVGRLLPAGVGGCSVEPRFCDARFDFRRSCSFSSFAMPAACAGMAAPDMRRWLDSRRFWAASFCSCRSWAISATLSGDCSRFACSSLFSRSSCAMSVACSCVTTPDIRRHDIRRAILAAALDSCGLLTPSCGVAGAAEDFGDCCDFGDCNLLGVSTEPRRLPAEPSSCIIDHVGAKANFNCDAACSAATPQCPQPRGP